MLQHFVVKYIGIGVITLYCNTLSVVWYQSELTSNDPGCQLASKQMNIGKKYHQFLVFCSVIILFNDNCILHLRSETITIHRWMRDDFGWLWWPDGIWRQTCPKFPDIHLKVEGKFQEKSQPETDSIRNQIWACWIRGRNFPDSIRKLLTLSSFILMWLTYMALNISDML